MNHLLKEKDIVRCESQEQYDRIIDLANAAGVPVYRPLSERRYWSDYPNLVMFSDGIHGTMSNSGPIHTEAEFVAKMFGVAPKDPPIRIKDWTVKFDNDGSITVGCTTVENATLNAICERANKAKKP